VGHGNALGKAALGSELSPDQFADPLLNRVARKFIPAEQDKHFAYCLLHGWRDRRGRRVQRKLYERRYLIVIRTRTITTGTRVR
jgi:hypothetical protein